jgi:hypothetical protein
MSDILERKRQNVGGMGYQWLCTAVHLEASNLCPESNLYIYYLKSSAKNLYIYNSACLLLSPMTGNTSGFFYI